MHTMEHGARAIWLLVELNWDRFLFPGAILVALMATAYLRSLGLI